MSYALIGVAFGAFHGVGFLTANILLYVLTAGLAYSIFYATWSTLIFENIGNTDRGTAMGVYNGLTGIATLLGAFASGYISYYSGYLPTFGMAAALMFVSLLIYRRRRKMEQQQSH
jgi:MFS family permease